MTHGCQAPGEEQGSTLIGGVLLGRENQTCGGAVTRGQKRDSSEGWAPNARMLESNGCIQFTDQRQRRKQCIRSTMNRVQTRAEPRRHVGVSENVLNRG